MAVAGYSAPHRHVRQPSSSDMGRLARLFAAPPRFGRDAKVEHERSGCRRRYALCSSSVSPRPRSGSESYALSSWMPFATPEGRKVGDVARMPRCQPRGQTACRAGYFAMRYTALSLPAARHAAVREFSTFIRRCCVHVTYRLSMNLRRYNA